MRKLIFFSFLLVGAGFGYLWGPSDDWLTRLLMMGVSMMFAGAMGGAVADVGRRSAASDAHDWYEIYRPMGSDVQSNEYAANYWRDKWHAPFSHSKSFEHEPSERIHIPHKW